MPRILGPLLACSFLYLYLWCTGTYCLILPNSCTEKDWFKCHDGECVPYTFRCDGDPDCNDGSDEHGCAGFKFRNYHIFPKCLDDEFRCNDNECIPLGKFCDLKTDCTDGSDEYENCTEKLTCEGMLRCRDGHCMRKTWLCDGSRDCPDGSDEDNCDNATIMTVSADKCKLEDDLFLCPNKRCVSLERTCDGKDDCGDGHDENGFCTNGTELCQKANCYHKCRKTPQGAVCVCESGYKENNRTCTDINECEIYGICSQVCINTAGSYRCQCKKNYGLLEDEKTCMAEGGEGTLIFSTRTEIRGIYLNSKLYFPIVRNAHNSISVAIVGDHLYWTERKDSQERIVKMSMGSEQREEVLDMGLHTVSGIVVDWVTSNIYFTDAIYAHIVACNNEGSFCSVLVKQEGSIPRGITLLPNTGMMYWCSWGSNAHIAQAEMDGENSTQLVTDNLGWPNSVSVDYPNGRIYWVDTKLKLVESIRLDGTDRRVVLQDVIKDPFSITVFENKLYWTDWNTNTIQYCDKFTGKNWTILHRTSATPLSIHIDHSALKPMFRNPCRENPCSQLCLLKRSRGYTCACNTDKRLSDDYKTCEALKMDHLIILAGRTIIEYYRDIIGKPRIHSLGSWHHITAATYDSITGVVLLSDRFLNHLVSYDPAANRTDEIYELAVKGAVTGMAHDYIGNNLYVSYANKRMMEVVNLDTYKKTILHFEEYPHDILLIPEEGIMFTVFEKANKQEYYINKLRMDATNPWFGSRPWIQFVKNSVHKGPKISLCYDRESKRVYYADQASGNVKMFSVHDLDLKFINSGLREPINFITAGEYFYWSVLRSNALYFMPKKKTFNLNRRFELEELDLTKYVHKSSDKIVHLISIPFNITVNGDYACRKKNGNCSHVCLTTSATAFVCACPPDMELSADNRTCISAFECPENEVQCKGQRACITPEKWCDGISDCPSNEDEPINCKPLVSCRKDQFKCRDGTCIDAAGRCNSHFDCADMSDEEECLKQARCKDDGFMCDNGNCINIFLVCNGEYDCSDLSDENNCRNNSCPAADFTCKETRQCIPSIWKCDGEVDCEDGSDEQNCERDRGKCDEKDFICKNAFCISSLLRCNGADDCGDNSDEEDCWIGRKSLSGNCTDDEYPCVNTDLCILKELRCDGVQHCPKNDDEHHCDVCLQEEFLCKIGKCIPKVWKCDGANDCGDNSDEEDCNSNRELQIDVNFNGSRKCDEFQCSSSGMCLPYSLVCNNHRDCPDSSDEQGKCAVACNRNNNCEELCFKTPQGGVCGCNEGYRLDNDGKSCIDIDECEDTVCSQICQNTVGSYKCSCFDTYVIRSDGVSCKAIGPPMEIFAAIDNSIKRISLNLHSVNVLDVHSSVEITGIDVNAVKNFVYWSNGELGTIGKMDLKSQKISTLVDASYPTKLAVDWITDNVYFIDKFYPNAIRVCNLEREKCAMLNQRAKKVMVMSLLVDPITRSLYWSETDRKSYKQGKILRASMTGRDVRVILSENIRNVDGMAIDYMHSRLYWMESAGRIIESSNFDGSERRKFTQTNENPLNLGIFENALYVLTDVRGRIKRCLLYGKQSCETVDIGRNTIHKHFAIMHVSRNPYVENLCERQNCDHVCILDTNGTACLCASGKLVKPNEICLAENEDGARLISNRGKSHNVRQSGGYSTVVITLLIIFLLSAGIGYCYYQKKKFKWNSSSELVKFRSIHFQNPTYDRADEVAVTLDRSDSSLTPGEHEYTNPVDDDVLKAAEDCSIEKLRRYPQRDFAIKIEKS